MSDAAVGPLVKFDNVSKSFGSIAANTNVNLTISYGAIVGLLGENGAGKSTAMNILAGLYLPDQGSIHIDGRPLSLGSPRAAIEAGIGMVHQQFRLVERLTGYDNCLLARNVGHHRFHRRDIDKLADELGFAIQLSAQVWQLSLAQRQQLEILRNLAVGARILVLDEPTSVLSPLESVRLFELLSQITAEGRAIILISHKLREVLAVATDLVIMRQGRVVFEGPAKGSKISDLSHLMLGDREIRRGRSAVGPQSTDPTLEVHDLKARADTGVIAVDGVSFKVHPGEIVAILGVTGNGQSELMETLGGLRPHLSGRMSGPSRMTGETAFIPARHLGVALAPGLDLVDNAMLGRQRRRPFGPWLKPKDLHKSAVAAREAFGVVGTDRGAVRQLSGGNLQRLVLGRELQTQPRLILADYPTRGLDVASAAQIREALVGSANAGAAVVLTSEEIDETIAIASRVLVVNGGRIVGDWPAASVEIGSLARLMTAGRATS